MGDMALFLRNGAWLFMLVLMAGLPRSSEAQATINNLDQPFFLRSWTDEQALPNTTINAITQTRNGYLWLGTEAGLARFDGVRCQVFGINEGLKNIQISALAEDAQGALWIGTAGGGISRMFEGEIKTYTIKDGLLGNTIRTILVDTNDDIWIGTTLGLSRLRQGVFQPVYKELAPANITGTVQDLSGNIWISTVNRGLFCLREGKLSPVTWPADDSTTNQLTKINARCLLVDSDNNLWMGMLDYSIVCQKDGKFIQYTGDANHLGYAVPTSLAQTSDGAIWVATLDRGLSYLPKGSRSFNRVRRADGLPDDSILSMYADHNQHLWIGNQAGGLTRLSPKQFDLYHVMESTYSHQYVNTTNRALNTIYHVYQDTSECSRYSLAQTTNGAMWVGTYGQGLMLWNTNVNHFEPYLQRLGKTVQYHLLVDCVLGASDGSLWWGAGPCVFQSKGGVLLNTNYNYLPWLIGQRVLSLCENKDGGMWVGLDNGQVRLLKTNSAVLIEGLPNYPVTDLAQAADGTLWISSLGGGLSRWQNGQLTRFTTLEKLNSDLVRTLYLDAEGTLWIGTDGGGLNRWANGQMTGFTTRDGLIDNIVLQILDDDDGQLWLGCNRGICRLSKRALEDLALEKPEARRQLTPFVIDTSEGLVSEQCIANFNAALKTKSNFLCFSTTKGYAMINPHKFKVPNREPTVLPENVLVDNKIFKGQVWSIPTESDAGPDKLPHPVTTFLPGRHSFEFHYTGIEFDAPEKIQFRYQLAGWDPGWNVVGEVRSALYNLPAGNYQFHVQCRTLNGRWIEPGMVMAFVVLPYFWQEPWFKIFAAIILIYLIATYIRWAERRRYQARLKRLEQEQAMERERVRIASDLHDELGANLTHISMLSEIGQATPHDQFDKLKKRMESISSASVQTVRALDEIVWAVNPRNDSLRSLLLYLTQFASELFEDTGIHCLFKIDEHIPEWPLPPDLRHNLFLVVKEALNNSLKYSKATEISLSATAFEGQIAISVQDNGAGFCLTTVQSTSKRNGLGNMRKRIEALGGQYVIDSIPGQGTTVKLTVNYPGTVSGQTKK